MAIQMRRGADKDFDKSRMLPGEIAVTTDGSKKVYIAFKAGDAKELAGADELAEMAKEITALEKNVDSIKTQLQNVDTQIKNINSNAEVQAKKIADVDERTRHIVLQINPEDDGLDLVYTQE